MSEISNITAGNDGQLSVTPQKLSVDTIIWIVYIVILFVFIICGNSLTFVAVRTCRRLRATLSNLFISALSVSDFFIGLTLPFHLAFYLVSDLVENYQLCLLRFFFIIFGCCVSIFTLITIAMDRYMAIMYPLHYRRFMTRRLAYILIAIIWCSGAAVASIPLFWNHFDTATQCEFDEILPMWYMAGIITPGFILIWTTMAVVYWRILREASKQAQQLRNSICSQKSTTARSDWKSVQIVVIIMGSFSICWLPYFIVASCEMFNLCHITPALYKGTLSLAMTNSSLNPLIYAWKNANFRRAFLKLLRCKNPNSCPRELIVSQCSMRNQAATAAAGSYALKHFKDQANCHEQEPNFEKKLRAESEKRHLAIVAPLQHQDSDVSVEALHATHLECPTAMLSDNNSTTSSNPELKICKVCQLCKGQISPRIENVTPEYQSTKTALTPQRSSIP